VANVAPEVGTPARQATLELPWRPVGRITTVSSEVFCEFCGVALAGKSYRRNFRLLRLAGGRCGTGKSKAWSCGHLGSGRPFAEIFSPLGMMIKYKIAERRELP
jgi:hypothetical protein